MKTRNNLHNLEITPNVFNNRFNDMTSHLREGKREFSRHVLNSQKTS